MSQLTEQRALIAELLCFGRVEYVTVTVGGSVVTLRNPLFAASQHFRNKKSMEIGITIALIRASTR